MNEKVVVLTGASDGIGAAAARRLAADGHRLVLVGRSPEKTARIARELGAESHLVDFAELDSVRELAGTLLAAHPRIDVLANNAGGVFGGPRELTRDGREITFQVNYLAPFLLTHLLLDRLAESRGTVVNTASVAHRMGRLRMDDLDLQRGYSALAAYGSAKLAQILFTRELDRRHGERGVGSVAFHPGNIASNFARQPGSALRWVHLPGIRQLLLTTPERGADTLVHLVEGTPGADFPSGEYFVRREVARTTAQANDPELARAL